MMDADKRALLDELEAAAVQYQAARAVLDARRADLIEVVRRARRADVAVDENAPRISVAYIVEVTGVSRQQINEWTKAEG